MCSELLKALRSSRSEENGFTEGALRGYCESVARVCLCASASVFYTDKGPAVYARATFRNVICLLA